MSFRQIAAALLAAALLGAGSRTTPLIVYSAPAGDRPAGADRIDPADAILPDGRICGTRGRYPTGRHRRTWYGAFAGRPVRHSRMRRRRRRSPIVNVATMKVASIYQNPSASFFMGVAATHDPRDPTRTIVLASDAAAGAVDVFDLDASGTLTAEAAVALPSTHGARAFPAQIAVSPDGRKAYVANNLGDSAIEIDLADRTVVQTIPAGDFPLYVAAGRRRCLLAALGSPRMPRSRRPRRNQTLRARHSIRTNRRRSRSLISLREPRASIPRRCRWIRAPDGTQLSAVRRRARWCRVATAVSRSSPFPTWIALRSSASPAAPRVVRGLDLRLYPGAPYGAQPSAVALSPDGKRLYVALAGLNAVAVLDARRATRYRFGPDSDRLVSERDGAFGRTAAIYTSPMRRAWTAARCCSASISNTRRWCKATLATLRYNRTPSVAKFNPVIPPLRSSKRSVAIDHVVYIAVGMRGYDAMLGDLKDDAGIRTATAMPTFDVYPRERDAESARTRAHVRARGQLLRRRCATRTSPSSPRLASASDALSATRGSRKRRRALRSTTTATIPKITAARRLSLQRVCSAPD